MKDFQYENPFFSENYLSKCKKPVDDIMALINYLSPISNKLETTERQFINHKDSDKRMCFILHKGSVTLYRRNDGIILNSESAPYIFGLSTQHLAQDYLSIRTNEDSEISYLSIDDTNKIIARHNLWKQLSYLMIYTITRIYDHCSKISSLSSYEIICHQLYELMNEPEDVRNQVSVATYIKDRTFLSRSSIMKILAQLKEGGYIVTDRGVLIELFTPPKKY